MEALTPASADDLPPLGELIADSPCLQSACPVVTSSLHTPSTDTQHSPADTALSAFLLPSVMNSGTVGSPIWSLTAGGISMPPGCWNGVSYLRGLPSMIRGASGAVR